MTVHETVQKESITSGVFARKPLIGTDTMSNSAMGNPSLQKVAAVQDHLDIKSRTPANFGKKIAKHEDEVLLLQCVKSVLYEHDTIVPIHPPTAGTTVTGKGTGGILIRGTTVILGAGGDETDADKMDIAVTTLHQTLAENDLDPTSDGFLYMAPAQYFAMLKSDKLISKDFSSNGDYANAAIAKICGMPIKMTNRLAQAQNDASSGYTSGDGTLYDLYGAAYGTSATEAKNVALYATGSTIMVAQSIPLTTDVYWDKRLLCWFIDSYEAFGAGPDRTDLCGCIFKA